MNAIVTVHRSDVATTGPDRLDFTGMRVWSSIPNHRDIEIVAMHGMAVIFDRGIISREDWQVGSLYVRESQSPPSALSWADWINLEHQYGGRYDGRSRLNIRREVVQYIRHPRLDGPSLRMASGFVDGPFCDHSFGADLIGKVVGIYLPGGAA